MKPHSVIKTDLFAYGHHRKKIDALGDPLVQIEPHINFATIEQMGDRLIRAIGQARANFAMTMMAACYNIKRLAYCQRADIVSA
jgi:hypothetical protein